MFNINYLPKLSTDQVCPKPHYSRLCILLSSLTTSSLCFVARVGRWRFLNGISLIILDVVLFRRMNRFGRLCRGISFLHSEDVDRGSSIGCKKEKLRLHSGFLVQVLVISAFHGFKTWTINKKQKERWGHSIKFPLLSCQQWLGHLWSKSCNALQWSRKAIAIGGKRPSIKVGGICTNITCSRLCSYIFNFGKI